MMTISVELFGIPRERAGVAHTTANGTRLGEVLVDLAERFPRLAETCFDDDQLLPGYVANLDGDRFLTDPQASLQAGDTLMILSADAGG